MLQSDGAVFPPKAGEQNLNSPVIPDLPFLSVTEITRITLSELAGEIPASVN